MEVAHTTLDFIAVDDKFMARLTLTRRHRVAGVEHRALGSHFAIDQRIPRSGGIDITGHEFCGLRIPEIIAQRFTDQMTLGTRALFTIFHIHLLTAVGHQLGHRIGSSTRIGIRVRGLHLTPVVAGGPLVVVHHLGHRRSHTARGAAFRTEVVVGRPLIPLGLDEGCHIGVGRHISAGKGLRGDAHMIGFEQGLQGRRSRLAVVGGATAISQHGRQIVVGTHHDVARGAVEYEDARILTIGHLCDGTGERYGLATRGGSSLLAQEVHCGTLGSLLADGRSKGRHQANDPDERGNQNFFHTRHVFLIGGIDDGIVFGHGLSHTGIEVGKAVETVFVGRETIDGDGFDHGRLVE